VRKIPSREWDQDVRSMSEREHDPRNYIGVEVILDWVHLLLSSPNLSRMNRDLMNYGTAVSKDGVHVPLDEVDKSMLERAMGEKGTFKL